MAGGETQGMSGSYRHLENDARPYDSRSSGIGLPTPGSPVVAALNTLDHYLDRLEKLAGGAEMVALFMLGTGPEEKTGVGGGRESNSAMGTLHSKLDAIGWQIARVERAVERLRTLEP